MHRELTMTVSRSWLLGAGPVVAVAALVVGLWVGINLSSGGQTSVLAASYDSESKISSHSTTDGYSKVDGAACTGGGFE